MIDSTKQHPILLQGKLPGVSSLNNFHYGVECLTAWKAFDVGEGKTTPWSQLQGKIYFMLAFTKFLFSRASFFFQVTLDELTQAQFIPLLLKAPLFQMSLLQNAFKSCVLYYKLSSFL